MTTEDRDKLLDTFRQGRATWLASLDGASNVSQRPGPERWSVLEIAEHVAIVEKRLAHVIRNAPLSGKKTQDMAAINNARRERRTGLQLGPYCTPRRQTKSSMKHELE